MDKSYLHLYWGDGKGKTTAAMGLALRALGRGKFVTAVQFLKDGTSGEIEPLRRLGAAVYAGNPSGKFTFHMTEADRQETKQQNTERLRQALCIPCDLLILDEACAVWQLDLVDRDLLQSAVLERRQETVLTGRNRS